MRLKRQPGLSLIASDGMRKDLPELPLRNLVKFVSQSNPQICAESCCTHSLLHLCCGVGTMNPLLERPISTAWPKDGLKESGIFISTTKGYLGASPDGLVLHGDRVCGYIEIKCPYSARNKTISDACGDSRFYMHIDGGKPSLKKGHNYYYQIQGQLAVLNLDWCDFIVWTTKGITVERIFVQHHFWKDQCSPKLDSFYYNMK